MLATAAPAELRAAETNFAALTSAVQVRALGRAEAARELPVRLRAVVTYYNEVACGDLVVQDGSGGIFIDGSESFKLNARPGEIVEIEGVTGPGLFAPVINLQHFKIIGTGELPPPRKINVEDLGSGREDSQFVELGGIVRAARIDEGLKPPRLILDIVGVGGRFSAYVLHHQAGEVASLVDTKVRVRGVCLHYTNRRRQAFNSRLVVDGSGDLVVERAAPADPFARPIQPVATLMQYNPEGPNQHRVRIQGAVTWQDLGRGLYVQADEQAIFVRTVQVTRVQLGDRLDLVGFPVMGEYNPVLEDTLFRIVEHGASPAPLARTAEEILNNNVDGLTVRVTGRLQDRIQGSKEDSLVLQSGNRVFSAQLDRRGQLISIPELLPGSELEVTGVCAVQLSPSGRFTTGGQPGAFRVLLRSPADVRIVSAAPWWTPSRMMRTLGLVSATLILALSWMIMLARKNRALRDQVLARKRAEAGLQLAHDKLEERVEERSRQLEEQIHARHDAEIEFQTVLRERNRLAAELHDTLEQGLTGVALQLEAADLSSAGSSNGLKRHITLARDLVRQSQTEVRRSIWDLKSSALERNDLAGALREIGVYLTEGSGVRIEVGVTGPVRALPDLLENHLLRIGQESITNAMKHAGPRRIEVSLDFAADAVCLKVRDDGSGFATGDRRSLLGEHFGLNGMRERAKRVGGKFQVESKPGAGTTITASVPLGAEIMADSGKSAGVRIPAEPAPRALGELASLK